MSLQLSILTLALSACAGAMFGQFGSGRNNWPVQQQHRLPKHNQYNYKNDNNYNRPDLSLKDCTTIVMGATTSAEKTLDLVFINVPRSMVEITDVNDGFVAGQEITVCNQDKTGAPAVLPPSDGFSPITVVSASSLKGYNYGATNLVMRVTQYLRPPTPLSAADAYGKDYVDM